MNFCDPVFTAAPIGLICVHVERCALMVVCCIEEFLVQIDMNV